jgi:CO/xanthine dehydrogenase Mo-binding subunit
LVSLAAQRWSVPESTLRVENGVVHSDGESVGYGELVKGQTLHVQAKPQSPLRDPSSHTIMGSPMPRVDIPAKLTGGRAYVQDLRLEGMLHGRIARPQSRHAQLVGVDIDAVAARAGVVKVVRDGRFLGVVAAREFQAVQAVRALCGAARWTEDDADLPPPEALYESLRSAPRDDYTILERGDVRIESPLTMAASYARPYQMHASIGPSCAVAQWVDGKMTVWTHTQGVYPLRHALAEMLRLSDSAVHCIHQEGSGCYGHNGADDVAADAALLARAVPGRPVRVQWMREEEHAWEPYGPPMLADVRAGLDEKGQIATWQYAVFSNTHTTRPGAAGDLLAATHLAEPFAASTPKPIPQPEGGGDRNAIPLYDLPNARVVHHFLPNMPVRVSAMRSLGAYVNVFAIESFMDELASAARSDPVAFRLRHLRDDRAREVIELAAGRFRWNRSERKPGRGRGFAFARYKNLGAYAAIALEVEVARDSGAVRVVRAVAAVDSGEVVNPDGIRNQIEGGIVQSASWSTLEEVTFDRLRVTSLDWAQYPILRFPQVPDEVEVHIIDRVGQPFLGTGEASQGPTAAAIANAVFDATGVRVRELPFSRERMRRALAGSQGAA